MQKIREKAVIDQEFTLVCAEYGAIVSNISVAQERLDQLKLKMRQLQDEGSLAQQVEASVPPAPASEEKSNAPAV